MEITLYTLVALFPGSPCQPGNEVCMISPTGITISGGAVIKRWLPLTVTNCGYLVTENFTALQKKNVDTSTFCITETKCHPNCTRSISNSVIWTVVSYPDSPRRVWVRDYMNGCQQDCRLSLQDGVIVAVVERTGVRACSCGRQAWSQYVELVSFQGCSLRMRLIPRCSLAVSIWSQSHSKAAAWERDQHGATSCKQQHLIHTNYMIQLVL